MWHEMHPMPSEFTAALPPLTATPPSAAEPSALRGNSELMSFANGAPTGAWQLMQDFAAVLKRSCCSAPSSAASCSFSPSVTGSCASMMVPVCASAIDDSFQSWTTSLWQSAQLFDATNAVLSLPNAALRATEHVPHVPREHGEEQDRDDRVQRAPRLELQDLRALTALAREVLLDVVGHLADLAPDDLLARVELRDLGVDLGERLAVLDEVVDELAEVPGLALRHLVDGDVDVQRLFLEADHVMPREAADAHEHAEHEEDHAGREVREERHHRRVHDRRDQGEDRQVHVRADPAHGAARHDLLAERGALAERVERAGADEQQRGEDAEPDDHREHHAAGRVHVLLDVVEAPNPTARMMIEPMTAATFHFRDVIWNFGGPGTGGTPQGSRLVRCLARACRGSWYVSCYVPTTVADTSPGGHRVTLAIDLDVFNVGSTPCRCS